MQAASDGGAVARSLECYEDRHGDPTTAIYTRFYAAHPDAEELFAGDTMIPRRMMSGILGIILDLADGTLHPAHSAAWVIDHVSYEVTRPMIDSMLDVIVDEVRTGLGEHWTPEMEADWAAVIGRWAQVVRDRLDEDIA